MVPSTIQGTKDVALWVTKILEIIQRFIGKSEELFMQSQYKYWSHIDL